MLPRGQAAEDPGAIRKMRSAEQGPRGGTSILKDSPFR